MVFALSQVIGVAQVINKNHGCGVFTKEDEEVSQIVKAMVQMQSPLFRVLIH